MRQRLATLYNPHNRQSPFLWVVHGLCGGKGARVASGSMLSSKARDLGVVDVEDCHFHDPGYDTNLQPTRLRFRNGPRNPEVGVLPAMRRGCAQIQIRGRTVWALCRRATACSQQDRRAFHLGVWGRKKQTQHGDQAARRRSTRSGRGVAGTCRFEGVHRTGGEADRRIRDAVWDGTACERALDCHARERRSENGRERCYRRRACLE